MSRQREVVPASGGPPNPDGWWRFSGDNRLKNTAIVLVEPSRGENVGAAARAMKTMGLNRLMVVGATTWRTGKARAMAVGAGEILEAVEEYTSLSEAVAEMRAVAITTARRRRRAKLLFPIESVAPYMLAVAEHGSVAVVFGREEYGLKVSELLLGDWWVTIPMSTAYPSLNLAQSVMVVCYELARAARGPLPNYPWIPATRERRKQVLEHAAKTLIQLGLHPRPDVESYLMALGRIFDRALVEEHDVELLHGLFHQMDQFRRQMGK